MEVLGSWVEEGSCLISYVSDWAWLFLSQRFECSRGIKHEMWILDMEESVWILEWSWMSSIWTNQDYTREDDCHCNWRQDVDRRAIMEQKRSRYILWTTAQIISAFSPGVYTRLHPRALTAVPSHISYNGHRSLEKYPDIPDPYNIERDSVSQIPWSKDQCKSWNVMCINKSSLALVK